MPIELPAYLAEMLSASRDPVGRAGTMRMAADQFLGPAPAEEKPLLDPQMAMLAGMPEIAQYGMQQQARGDQRRQMDMESALKLLSLIQAGQGQDDRTALGWSGLGEQSRQFDAGQGLDVARMAQQEGQFGRSLGQQRELAGMTDARGWADLMSRTQQHDADRGLAMQQMQMQAGPQQQQALAQLISALGGFQQQSAMANVRNLQANALMQGQQGAAAGGAPPAAGGGGIGAGEALLALAAAVAAWKGGKWALGKYRGTGGATTPAQTMQQAMMNPAATTPAPSFTQAFPSSNPYGAFSGTMPPAPQSPSGMNMAALAHHSLPLPSGYGSQFSAFASAMPSHPSPTAMDLAALARAAQAWATAGVP